MDKKIVGIFTDSDNVIDTNIKKLYKSLNKDIDILCKSLDEERSSGQEKNKKQIVERINIVIKLISELQSFSGDGTNYLG